jgi:lipopolysaccharide transport system permease protein
MNQSIPTNTHNVVLSTSLVSFAKILWYYRQLIVQMTKREVAGRYRGSFMGFTWTFFTPVLMLIVYTFVFGVVFNARWNIGGDEGKTNFAMVLFIGLIIHGFFAECINRAPNLIISNISLVKKVVFPLEILPVVAIACSLFHLAISSIILVVALLLYNAALPWTVILFPIVLFPLILMTIGLSLFLASIGVYLRDISQLTGFLMSALLFLAPVFYPISSIPKEYQGLLQINPLTFPIEEARKVMLWGKGLDLIEWLICFCINIVILWLGFWWFQKTRKGFSDVI